jgi:hypothetical protein
MLKLKLINLAEFANKETISILKSLLARAIKGEIVGIALCFRTKQGDENVVFSGTYKTHPAEAVNAAMRLSWKLTQMQDQPTH